MQNRFTVKDFIYMVIGGLICLLLWLNITKTGREATTLDNLTEAFKDQQVVLNSLGDAIESFESSASTAPALDAAAIRELAQSIAGARSNTPNTTPDLGTNGTSETDSERLATMKELTPGEELPVNLAETPSFVPGFAIQNAVWTDAQNLKGLPQGWQTAPDAELPDDFASGDTLIWSWPTDAESLTPLIATDAYSRYVHWYTHEYLVNFNLDAPFEPTPGLARSWEVSSDGMTLDFHLFEHATWSDGRPITADDVIFTWDTAMNEKLETAHLRGYIAANIKSWEKLGPHTVRFEMKQPYFDAVGICGQLLWIIPRHVYGNYDEDTFNEEIQNVCVGSGPYILESWEKNSQIVLTRNENYWGAKPAVEQIIIRIIKNELANLQEFRAGNVDLMAPTSEQWVESIDAEWFRESGAGKSLYYSPRGGYSYIGYNLRKPHFADKRTRQALTMLLDRQAIIDTLIAGMGIPISGPFYFKSDQYNQKIEPWPYDPDRARELLAEVGWEDTDGDGVIDKDLDGDGVREPFEVTFLCPAGSVDDFIERLQRFTKDAFAKAGIKLNLDRIDWTVFLERLDSRQFDIVSLAWTGSPEGDPYQIWHSASEANKGSNFVGFKNARADELIELGRSCVDYDQRMEYWHEFHALVHEEQPYTFLFGRPGRSFVHRRFKNALQRDYRQYYGEWYVPSADQLR